MHFFNRVTLLTPESVELEFTLAGIGNRALALLVDYIIWGLILLLFLSVWGIVSTQLLDAANNLVGSDARLGLWLIAIAALIGFVIYVGYFVVFEVLWQGQTPGKRYTKIRVIRDDGRTIGLQQATLRALLRPIDDAFFVGAILIMLGKREKRLGDWVAGTIVVQEERPVIAAPFVIEDQAQSLATQLLQQADVSQLLPDDFAVVREYLQRRRVMAPKARGELSLNLARQVKAVIALEKVPPNVNADLFLEAVYLAYQQQSLAP